MSPVQRLVVTAADAEHIGGVELRDYRGNLSRLQFAYDSQGLTSSIQVTGGKMRTSDMAALLPMLFREYISRIDLIKLINEIQLIDRITLVDTISAITNIANLQSVDLIDRITLIDEITKIDAITDITNIANLQSLDLIDRISLIDEITKIDAITEITTITNPVNVKTSGGTNIVLDKLNQDAYRDRATTAATLYKIADDDTPAGNTTSTYLSAYFVRGMRGFIGGVWVYGRSTSGAAKNAVIAFCIAPGMAPVYTATISVGTSNNWYGVNVMRKWDYDSMFFYVAQAVDAQLEFGYLDTGNLYSGDSGASWAWRNTYACCLRVSMVGQTVGDTGPSIVNNIPIPNAASARQHQTLNVPAGSELLDTTQVGAGSTLIVIFSVEDDDDITHLIPRIYCDGGSVLPDDLTMTLWQSEMVNAYGEGMRIGVWDTTNHFYSLIVTVKYPFKQSLKIGFYNNDALNVSIGSVGYSYEKIS